MITMVTVEKSGLLVEVSAEEFMGLVKETPTLFYRHGMDLWAHAGGANLTLRFVGEPMTPTPEAVQVAVANRQVQYLTGLTHLPVNAHDPETWLRGEPIFHIIPPQGEDDDFPQGRWMRVIPVF